MMRTMRLASLMPAFLIVLSASCRERQVSIPTPTKSDGLALVIKTTKQSYVVGEDIVFSCMFTNQGTSVVTILPWGEAYASYWMHAIDSRFRPAKGIETTIFDSKHGGPNSGDFIRLAPGQTYMRQFYGHILRGEIKRFDRVTSYRGLFIEFDYSALQLGKAGTYQVWAEYDASTWAKSASEAFLTNNAFQGSLASAPIRISIADK